MRSCFVIMPFSRELKPVYDDAIKPAAEAEGFECVRVDEIPGAGNIVRGIVESIQRADVVIADLTSKNANVFYELGIAHALGNNVIALAQSVKEDVPFDVGNYKVLQYDMKWGGEKRLKADIQQALRTLEQWSQKPSNPVQDFLPSDSRPVPRQQYTHLADRLRCKEDELDRTAKQLSERVVQQEEIEKLRSDNLKLNSVRQFVELLIKSVPDSDVTSTNVDDMMKDFLAEVAAKVEVTVPMSSSSEEGRGGIPRIVFRKVNK